MDSDQQEQEEEASQELCDLDPEQPGAFAVRSKTMHSLDAGTSVTMRPSVTSLGSNESATMRPSMTSLSSTESDGPSKRRSNFSNLLERQQPAMARPSYQQDFGTMSSEFLAVAIEAEVVDDETESELRVNGGEHALRPPLLVSHNSTFVVTAVPEEMMAQKHLGPGPMRFAPPRPKTLGKLDLLLQNPLYELEQRWTLHQKSSRKRTSKCNAPSLSAEWHQRFLWFYAQQNSNGNYTFPMDKIVKAEKKLKPRFVNLNVGDLGPQLYSKTLGDGEILPLSV